MFTELGLDTLGNVNVKRCDAPEPDAGLTEGNGALHERSALFTFRRPPLTVFVASAATGSTLLRSALLSAAVSSEGHPASVSIAAPDTCAVAMEGPLQKAYWLLVIVERM